MRRVGKEWRRSVADQVGSRLRQHILRSGLRPGDRLPSYRTLAQELGVAYMTVKRGVEGLARDGIVTSFHGKGPFVGGGLARRPQALRHALLVFPASMHHVLSYAYAGETVRGALLALEEHGIGSSIRFMVGEGIIHGDYVDRLHADAVILIGVENEEYLRKAATWGRTAVAVDYCSAAVPMGFVARDNRSATPRLLEHIACIGHRRIAYLGSEGERTLWMKGGRTESLVQRSSDSPERREGVRAAAAALGLPAPRFLLAPEGSSFDEPLTQAFRRASDRPTALVLESDLAAPGAMGWLASHGLRVPQDVSICAVAGASALAECPGLTYCRFDFLDMGRKAVAALRESFAQPGEPVNRIHRIGFEFVKGKTTAKAQERRTRRETMRTVFFACLVWLSVAIRSVAAEPAGAGKPAAAAYRQEMSLEG